MPFMNGDDSLPPSRGRRISLWRVGGTLLSLGLLGYLISRQGWGEFAGVVRGIPAGYLALALGIVLCSRVFVTLRWYVLLRSAKARISLWQTFQLVFTGLFSSNFLPSTVGGDVVRLAGGVFLRIDAGVVAASLVVDRLVGMAGMALLLPVGLAAVLSSPGGLNPAGQAWNLSLTGMLPRLQGLRERGLRFLRSLLQSLVTWLRHPAGLGGAFACTFGHMLATYLTVEVLLRGMGYDMPLWQIGGLWSFSYFFSLAPLTINGLGLQEVSIAYLYSHFGGIPMQTGLALAVLLRLFFMLASLPGAIFLPMLGSERRSGEPAP
uniref:Flippase-like domain-containing protein n=1 Tax=Anaerolinea thermolimosa TaxID=229919 RepID=A0A7C4KFR2_9CHLR